MASIPHASKYKTTGSAGVGRGSAPHSPPHRGYEGGRGGQYAPPPGHQNVHVHGGDGSVGTILLLVLGIALVVFFPKQVLVLVALLLLGKWVLGK